MPIPLTERQEIWRGLLYGQRSLALRLTAELKSVFDLTAPQYEALLTLWEAPGNTLPANTLAKRLLYSSGSASHLISRLEERGLVRRRPDPADARVTVVGLTRTGLAKIEAATRHHLASIDREFAPLIEDADVAPLLDVTRRLAAHEGVRTTPE